MKANLIELQENQKTVHVDQMSGASTVLFTCTLDRGITWESASTMLDEKKKDGLGSTTDGFYESKREWLGKRHFVLAFESSASGMFKIVRPAVGEAVREMPLAELKYKYRKISLLEKARHGWEDEYEVSSKEIQLCSIDLPFTLYTIVLFVPDTGGNIYYMHGFCKNKNVFSIPVWCFFIRVYNSDEISWK